LGELNTIRSGVRIEAIALAGRAHIATGDRKAAHQLLRQAWKGSLKHHRLCRHLAIACLELGDYRRAAALTAKAAELSEIASAGRPHEEEGKPSPQLAKP
jgi:Flp pilus assembly protein TadD